MALHCGGRRRRFLDLDRSLLRRPRMTTFFLIRLPDKSGAIPRPPYYVPSGIRTRFATAPHPRGSGNGRFDRGGSCEDGKLGMGDWEEDWAYRIQFLEPKNVVAVVGGNQNSLAICVKRQLYTWGRNQRGTLGHPPETKTESIPSLVDSLSGVKIVQVDIAGGGWHSAALTDDGEVYAWGRGKHGRLGLGGESQMVPEKVQLLDGANIVKDLVEALSQWH